MSIRRKPIYLEHFASSRIFCPNKRISCFRMGRGDRLWNYEEPFLYIIRYFWPLISWHCLALHLFWGSRIKIQNNSIQWLDAVLLLLSEHVPQPQWGSCRDHFSLLWNLQHDYSFQGNCYNIPVTVYLWDTHPYYAPICFVNPTSTMVRSFVIGDIHRFIAALKYSYSL